MPPSLVLCLWVLKEDFTDPFTLGVVETINISKPVDVKGLSYTYLDSHMPLQASPFDGSLTQFYVLMAPMHAGAMTLDYQFTPTDYGILSVHLDIMSKDSFSYNPYGEQRLDAYTLINGRVTLADINLGNRSGALRASLWGKNLADEEYIVDAFAVGDPAVTIANAYGDPRTLGIEFVYDFH